jgi:hypothetical protein
VSVVGFDDIFGSDFCHPPLSTVTAPVEQAGRTLIDLLLGSRDLVGARDARSAPRIVLPTVLRVRDSTGPVLNLGRLLISQEFGQRLSDRTRGFGGRQMAASGEYPQSASGDCVDVLASASRWYDAVVLARSKQERNRDPVKVRATVELRESLAGQRVGLGVGIRQGLQQPPGGVAVALQETGSEPALGGSGYHHLRAGLADEFGSLPPRGRLADARRSRHGSDGPEWASGQTELERHRTTEGYTRVVGRPPGRGRVGQGPHGRGQVLDRESFRSRPAKPVPRQVPSDHLEAG